MAANRIMVTWGFLRIDRSWGNMDSSMNYLYSSMDQPKLFRRYFREREKRTLKAIRNSRALRQAILNIPDTIAEYGLFLNPQIRSASRMFKGYSSKLADVGEKIFSLLTKASFVSVIFVILMFTHAYYPHILERISWLDKLLSQFPFIFKVSQWMSQYPQVIWIALLLFDFYLYYAVVRPIAKRLGDEEIRLPSNSRA
jgi:hypothetical protein